MNIAIHNLNKIYPGGKKALSDISLSLESPDLIGLVGPNGAGKSTLMKLLTASLLPTSGTIQMDGTALISCEKELKRKLGCLPQSFGLYDELTVWQFLDYMAALKGISSPVDSIRQVIGQTNLSDQQHMRISALSGGQRQRTGIAQALLGGPEFLILDEPTVGLDPEERISFRTLFSETARRKLVILSTHIIEDVQSICNRLIILDGGCIRFDGTPSQLIRNADGHVGTFESRDIPVGGNDCHITAQVNTAHGISCRIVADNLPSYAAPAAPSLEEAYLYCIRSSSVASPVKETEEVLS